MTTKTAQHVPSFACTEEDNELILKIVRRVEANAKLDGVKYPFQDIMMDLKACHCNGCPLDLKKLLNAPDDSFGHDTYGIRRFISRTTGQMPDTFLPRCATKAKA